VAGGVPHHSFHVFEVYPRVGLLRDDRKAPTALNVLDRCRFRWGTVISVKGDEPVVKTLLGWNGRYLALGEPVLETATFAVGSTGFVDDLAPGDFVSLHLHWICDKLTSRQMRPL